jgi:hypothetical protein
MSEPKAPDSSPAPAPRPDAAKPPALPPEHQNETLHPGHHHDHVVIKPPSTGISHIDPGVVGF